MVKICLIDDDQNILASLSLALKSEKFDVRFLEKEPISIAYYDYTNKVLKWDFDYNRTMIEKIIEAQLIE